MKSEIRTGIAILGATLLTAAFCLGVSAAGTPPDASGGQAAGTARQSSVKSGICGYRVTWDFDEDTGTLTVSGQGEMTSARFDEYRDKLRVVRIGEGITSVPAGAFDGCTLLREVTLPDSMLRIGEFAFRGCSALESLRLPKGITAIAPGTFSGDSALDGIDIPDGVSVIGAEAFRDCAALTHVTLPDSVKKLGEGAFAQCTALETVVLPAGLTAIPANAFYGCGSLSDVETTEEIQSVGENAFRGCGKLTALRFGKALETVGDMAFAGCVSLSEYTLSGKVRIGTDAFLRVPAQKQLRLYLDQADLAAFAAGHTDFTSATGTKQFLLYLNGKELTSLLVPAGVRELPDGVFAGCVGLRDVLLPDSVVSVGAGAFAGCHAITRVRMTSAPRVADDAFEAGAVMEYAKHLNGWIDYPGGVRYYENGVAMDGWFLLDGKMYYATYLDKLVIDHDASIRGQQYFWNGETGLTLAEGVIETADGYRYFVDGKESFGWCEYEGRVCYARYDTHEILMADQVIGGRQYVWDPLTGLTLKHGLYLEKSGAELWESGRRVVEWGFHEVDGVTYYITYSVNNLSGELVLSDKRIGGVDYIWGWNGLTRK